MNSRDNMLFLLVGVAIGAGAAFLYAPRSGTETRAYLKSKAQEGSEYLEETTGAAMQSARDKVERVKKTAGNIIERAGLKDKVGEAVAVGKQVYRDAQDGAFES
jgi:gas vesicle protein